jgi:hypothetical protein
MPDMPVKVIWVRPRVGPKLKAVKHFAAHHRSSTYADYIDDDRLAGED